MLNSARRKAGLPSSVPRRRSMRLARRSSARAAIPDPLGTSTSTVVGIYFLVLGSVRVRYPPRASCLGQRTEYPSQGSEATLRLSFVARPSRPPGFDMTYRPADKSFGPPLVVRLPSLLYLLVALGVVTLVIVAESSSSTSVLFDFFVRKNPARFIGARTFAAVLLLSAVAALLRAGMRGVHLRGDGLEYRDVVSFTWPKIRRFKWAQIDRVLMDQQGVIGLDLWDGSRTFLPPVSDHQGLMMELEKVAAARAIPVRGGCGLDEIPDARDYDDEEDHEAR